ncbi:MAG TPA: cytochrome b/b6 domain-containing protein [Steroidobacteraceae bacterium]
MKSYLITHPAWLRTTHWLNVLAFVLMVMSGWRIYNASPLFPNFTFPVDITLGGWLGGALLWHFAAMWLLVANGLLYLIWSLATGRFRRQLRPPAPAQLFADIAAAARGRLSHDDLTHFNAIQKLAYLIAIAALILIVLSGLVVFKSVQFPLLRELLGGYDSARFVHFFCMATLVSFLAVHLLAALFVPKTIVAMIRGY